MVFQQSRVKKQFRRARNRKKKWNGEKAKAFLLQPKDMYEETQAIQRTEQQGQKTEQKVQA